MNSHLETLLRLWAVIADVGRATVPAHAVKKIRVVFPKAIVAAVTIWLTL